MNQQSSESGDVPVVPWAFDLDSLRMYGILWGEVRVWCLVTLLLGDFYWIGKGCGFRSEGVLEVFMSS